MIRVGPILPNRCAVYRSVRAGLEAAEFCNKLLLPDELHLKLRESFKNL